MLILLPPSAGRAAPSAGRPVELETLAFAAALTESRRNLLGALERLAAEPVQRAVAMLGVSSGQAAEVAGVRALAAFWRPALKRSMGHLDVIVSS